MITPRRRPTVSDVMTSRVHVARPLTPFKRLVQLIEENRISAIPIVDAQGVPIGIVSESDLLFKERRHELETESSRLHPHRRRQERAKAEGVVAWEIMTKPTITVRSDATLPQAARVMQERKVRRLVVVDERDKIVESSVAVICCRSSFARMTSFVTRCSRRSSRRCSCRTPSRFKSRFAGTW